MLVIPSSYGLYSFNAPSPSWNYEKYIDTLSLYYIITDNSSNNIQSFCLKIDFFHLSCVNWTRRFEGKLLCCGSWDRAGEAPA